MPLRDLALTALVFGALPVCFRSPYIGVLMYSWMSFMNPHRYTWGFAQQIPLIQLVAIATLAGLLFTRDRRPLPRVKEVGLLLALWALFVLTTLTAMYPDLAWEKLGQVSKVLLMVFVTIMVCQDRARLRNLLLVTALSIGFFGLKGGIWGLAVGGEHHVLGPSLSFFGDNNGLSMALNMVLPILFYLAREERRWWMRGLLRTTFAMTVVSVLLTYSRSGFLGLMVVLSALTLRTRAKVLVIPAALVALVAVAWFLPEKWYDRMETIQNYEEDVSANARLTSWYVGWRLALDQPILGGGFFAFSKEAFERYVPGYPSWHNAHSIYFHVLGEHGFTGLILFGGLILSLFGSLWAVRREARRVPGARWAVEYSHMVQASLLGYLATGTFLNLTYFDLYYVLVGVTVILRQVVRDMQRAEAPVPESVAAVRAKVAQPAFRFSTR
jgi:probable O-glycosylation ligase (exosortase A-associated)